jgi:glycosyltransferase involved in cell wall biosynthesis
VRDIVLISYTPLDAPGGVPRWNRDFIRGFPGTKHYSWWDVCACYEIDPNGHDIPEWDKAKILNLWLLATRRVTPENIIIADSFWAAGLEHLPGCISHQHGNWSHTTADDVERGIPPEFPMHADVQLNFRKRCVGAGRRLTTVSDFIADQMHVQWGFDSTVINNGIDLDEWKPISRLDLEFAGMDIGKMPLIVHGVPNGDKNKGWDHVDAVVRAVGPNVLVRSLDEAKSIWRCTAQQAFSRADLVVIPSAHEGNSYFCLEALACNVPIVAYKVGLPYSLSTRAERAGITPVVGCLIDRKLRSPEKTAAETKFILESVLRDKHVGGGQHTIYNPREVASLFSIQKFWSEWRTYLEELERAVFPGR